MLTEATDDEYDAITHQSAQRGSLCNRAWRRGKTARSDIVPFRSARTDRDLCPRSRNRPACPAVEFGPVNVPSTQYRYGVFEADDRQSGPRILKTPLRRVGKPEDIAGAAVFLASPAGAFVTGHNLVVDGGTVIGD